jgi:hypothetical protein
MGTSFKEAILRIAGDESIEKIVVGQLGGEWRDPDPRDLHKDLQNKLLDPSDVLNQLDYPWDASFGSEDCPPIYAWTKSKVIFVVCYDGSTYVSSIPRNPTEEHPMMFGGG